MKRKLAVYLLSLVLAASAFGCGAKTQPTGTSDAQADQAQVETDAAEEEAAPADAAENAAAPAEAESTEADQEAESKEADQKEDGSENAAAQDETQVTGETGADNTDQAIGETGTDNTNQDTADIDAAAPAEADEEEASQAEEQVVEQADAAAAEGIEDFDDMYAFVSVKYDGNKTIIVPNGTVGDDTVLYNDKNLGGLCDYIDSKVLEDGRTINRKFLYGLVSVQIVDPQLMQSYDQFNRAMIYCLTIANEFYANDVTLVDLVLDAAENTKQSFDVLFDGKANTWILDGHENKFYLNDGATEYISTMFDAETMAVWSLVLDQYFEEQ